MDDRHIRLLDRAIFELPRDPPMRFIAFGDEHDAGRVAIGVIRKGRLGHTVRGFDRDLDRVSADDLHDQCADTHLDPQRVGPKHGHVVRLHVQHEGE